MQLHISRRLVPPLAAIALFLVAAVLYLTGQASLYDGFVRVLGVDTYRFPFLDTDTVLSAVRCFNRGIDAYVTNPCDDRHRVYTYSPLWMALRAFPVSTAWIAPAGLLVDGAFLAALFLLPPGRSRWAVALITLGAVSSATAFAVERGNNDLVLFTLVTCTAALATRTPALRTLGYACALLAGLLKYYPMAVLAMAARERPGRLLAIAAAALLVTLGFVAVVWGDLLKAFANIPVGSYYHDMFGAMTIAGGLRPFLGYSHHVETAIRLVMTLAALAAGAWMATFKDTPTSLARLTPVEHNFLLVGALMTIGCFFTAQNIGYRAVHLLLALPALTVLASAGGPFRFRIAAACALFVMVWNVIWRDWLLHALTTLTGVGRMYPFIALWFARELAWWLLIAVLLSIVARFLLDAPISRVLVPARLRPPAEPGRDPAAAAN